MRLVVLNACEGGRGGDQDILSSTAAILSRRGVPAVLAMQYEMSDEAAVQFARTFYESITDHLPVDAAVVEARKALRLAGSQGMDWGIPVLYMRSPDGILFHLTKDKSTGLTKDKSTGTRGPDVWNRHGAPMARPAPPPDPPHRKDQSVSVKRSAPPPPHLKS